MNMTEAAMELERQSHLAIDILSAEVLRQRTELEHLHWAVSFLWETLKEAESSGDIAQLRRRLRAAINIVEPQLQ